VKMKSHDFARLLRDFADLLERGPDVEIRRIKLSADSPQVSTERIAVSLSTLVELSRIDKNQWIALIREHGFPIVVRPRDASRDILGKLLAYLEQNEEARLRLRKTVQRRGEQVSSSLTRALASLLGDDH
jgi:hypothetical protein